MRFYGSLAEGEMKWECIWALVNAKAHIIIKRKSHYVDKYKNIE